MRPLPDRLDPPVRRLPDDRLEDRLEDRLDAVDRPEPRAGGFFEVDELGRERVAVRAAMRGTLPAEHHGSQQSHG